MTKQTICTDKAPRPIGPYAQAIKLGDIIFTSGQVGIDMQTGTLAQGIENQAHAALKNVGAILEEAGSSYDKALKCTVFVVDLADFATVNQIYSMYFKDNCPARSCVQVAKLPQGALIEIECIAAV